MVCLPRGTGFVCLVRGATVGVPEVWSNGTCSGWTCQDLINEKALAGFTITRVATNKRKWPLIRGQFACGN
jgi:hypothetical protein